MPDCDFTGPLPYDCTGCDLSGQDLSGKDLRGAIFKDAILEGTIFKGTRSMAGTDLRGAVMGRGTDFSGLDLTGVLFDSVPAFGTNETRPTILSKARISFNQLGPAWRYLDLSDAEITDVPADLGDLQASKSNLSRLDFSGKQLSGAQFYGCTMTAVKLAGCELRNAIFSRSDLSMANLSNAKCEGAVFDRATLTRTNFSGATLGGASFLNAALEGTRFENTDVRQCAFSLPPSFSTDPASLTSFKNSKLPLAILSKEWTCLNLEGAEIEGLNSGVILNNLRASFAVLSGLNLAGFSLESADLSGATIDRCVFDGAAMTKAQMKGTKGVLVKFIGTTLNNAHFGPLAEAQSVLPGADFSRAKLNGAIFSKADLRVYKDKEKAQSIPTQFDKAVMTDMEFSGANLSGAMLTGGVLLHNTNFTGANLREAHLTGAQMGSFSRMFEEMKGATGSDYDPFLNSLTAGLPYGMSAIFRKYGYELSDKGTVVTIDIAGTSWTLADSSTGKQYNVLKWTTNSATALIVSAPVQAAILSNANLYNVKLGNADLRKVNASEVQLYGPDVELEYAKLHGISLLSSNLADLKMVKAALYNATFNKSILVNAVFTGAEMTGVSMEKCHIQGAVFTGTYLDNVNLSNCAVSVSTPDSTTAGVYLFGLGPGKEEHAAVLRELEAIPPVPPEANQPEWLAGKPSNIDSGILALDKHDLAALKKATPDRTTQWSDKATISTLESGKAWSITDGGTSPAKTYTVWDGVTSTGFRKLFIQAAHPRLNELFKTTGLIKLRYQAAISRRTISPDFWTIDNDTNNPDNEQLGFTNVLVVKDAKDYLTFYGTSLRYKQPTDTGKEKIVTRTFNPTNLARNPTSEDCGPDGTDSVFGKDTTCPNTMKFSTNQTDKLPWLAMLRARTF